MRKGISYLLICLLLTALLPACVQQDAIPEEPVVEPIIENPYEDLRVGMILSTLLNPFFVSLKDGALMQAEDYELELIVLDSRDSADREVENMTYLIEEQVDAIILNTTDPVVSTDLIETAVEKGIHVITIDRNVQSDKISMHIASDNYTGGRLAGHYILEQLEGSGNVVQLLGLSGASVDAERGDGFHSVIESSQVDIIVEKRADFDREMGQTVMSEILEQYDKIDAVFAHNDEMALGALKAITLAERDIIVVGFDGSDDAVIAVQDGSMAATIAQQPLEIGKEGLRAVAEFLIGKSLDEEIRVPLKLITKLSE